MKKCIAPSCDQYTFPNEEMYDNLKKERTIDNAFEGFDYIMNSQSTYNSLGEAVALFEASKKRSKVSTKVEILRTVNGSTTSRKWFRKLIDVVNKARRDYKKNFLESNNGYHPEWVDSVNLHILIQIAMQSRDRWV